ncbi:MAG: beta-ketoacyl-[Bacteroidales bacterium]|nr:beta-ketoacyl-[acyl-carrier-protein] synthase family protein [Bacteroidales bacterium]
RVAVGGSEALSSFHLNGFNSLMIVDKEPCRPFDKSRAGLNLGEGAAFLILESEESLRGRGGKALARLSGFGNACDAYHQTASSPTGEGAFLAMRKALSTAGLRPEDIDYVNAHGTGTPDNDAAESAALRRVFGEALPPVSSTKAFTGHTTSASGSIEAVICLLALSEGFVPRQLNWKEADPACIIPSVKELERPLRHVLCNSFGFGGNDTSLLISNA